MINYDTIFTIELPVAKLDELRETADRESTTVSEKIRDKIKKGLKKDPRPLKKRLTVRLNSSMKRDVLERANTEGISVSEWINGELDGTD